MGDFGEGGKRVLFDSSEQNNDSLSGDVTGSTLLFPVCALKKTQQMSSDSELICRISLGDFYQTEHHQDVYREM